MHHTNIYYHCITISPNKYFHIRKHLFCGFLTTGFCLLLGTGVYLGFRTNVQEQDIIDLSLAELESMAFDDGIVLPEVWPDLDPDHLYCRCKNSDFGKECLGGNFVSFRPKCAWSEGNISCWEYNGNC